MVSPVSEALRGAFPSAAGEEDMCVDNPEQKIKKPPISGGSTTTLDNRCGVALSTNAHSPDVETAGRDAERHNPPVEIGPA